MHLTRWKYAGGAGLGNSDTLGLALACCDLLSAAAGADAAVPPAAGVPLLAAGHREDLRGGCAAAQDSACQWAGPPAWAPAAGSVGQKQGSVSIHVVA